MFSSSRYHLSWMWREGGTHSSWHLTHRHHPWRPMEGWQGGMLVLICWEAAQWSLRLESPQQEESDLVAGESSVLVYHYCFHFHQLCWWIHESVQRHSMLCYLRLPGLSQWNTARFSHCWLCWPVEPSIHDHFRRVSWVTWLKLTSPKSFSNYQDLS